MPRRSPPRRSSRQPARDQPPAQRPLAFRHGAALFCAIALLAAATHSQERPRGTAAEGAEARLIRTLEAALASPRAEILDGRSASELAAITADTWPTGPVLEWQSEGLGSGFDHEPNAADSLRLRKEISLPHQRAARQSHLAATGDRLAAERRAARAELLDVAGRGWLELAAITEHRRVVEHRLDRLEHALTIHHRRLELGEVAGSEVRQLELQKARDTAARMTLEIEAETAARGLARWVGGEIDAPRGGDLEALLGTLAPLPQSLDSAGGPMLRRAEARAAAATSEAELEQRTAWGLPEAEIEAQRIPSTPELDAFETFGFRIAIPLGVGEKGRARRAAALARQETARAEQRLATLETEQRRAEAMAAVDTSETALATLETLAGDLPRIEHSLAEQFRLGAISYLVYLDGLERGDRLRADLIDARLALATARLTLATLLADSTLFPIPDLPEEDIP